MSAALDHQTLEAAATWYVQLNGAPPTDAQRQAWQRWLGESPLHAQAWSRVEKLQRQFGALPAEVSLNTLAGARARRRVVLKTLGVLLAAGVAGWSTKELAPTEVWMAQYRTGTGQRRGMQLSDGSQLDMNTNSAVDVAYDDQLRLIRLHRGQILIQTSANSDPRPFVVHTPEGSVRALGTRFEVRIEGDRTRVSVLQHAVQLRPLHQPSSLLTLAAGQRAEFSRDRLGPPGAVPPGAEAWIHGMLTVIDWRLADFLAELGRYRPGLLRCAPSIAGLRLSGAFRTDDTDKALENLSASLPVKVRYLTRYWATVEPA